MKQSKGNPDRFAALCVMHGEVVTFKTRRAAHIEGAHSKRWCLKCGGPKGKSLSVPLAKAKLAIKPDFKLK
jgi:hypothetical protein